MPHEQYAGPGYVGQISEAFKQVERTAADHAARWDVKEAFFENLKDFRNEPWNERLQHAVTSTKAEIRANEMEETTSTQTQEITRTPKPAKELTNQEIVTEVRELHSRFQGLAEQYSTSQGQERETIRKQMEPIVGREHALRDEYKGRNTQELSVNQDRTPDIGYAR